MYTPSKRELTHGNYWHFQHKRTKLEHCKDGQTHFLKKLITYCCLFCNEDTSVNP